MSMQLVSQSKQKRHRLVLVKCYAFSVLTVFKYYLITAVLLITEFR